jgi:hypothetical protein
MAIIPRVRLPPKPKTAPIINNLNNLISELRSRPRPHPRLPHRRPLPTQRQQFRNRQPHQRQRPPPYSYQPRHDEQFIDGTFRSPSPNGQYDDIYDDQDPEA